MSYSENEIRNRLEEPTRLYNKECVNNYGQAESGRFVTEIIAEQLLMKDTLISIIRSEMPNDKEIRKNFYFDGMMPRVTNPSYKEEAFCSKLWIDCFTNNKRYRVIDKVVATKIQLYNNIAIDLISLSNQTVYISNVHGYKDADSIDIEDNDTLLKCILEIEYQYEILLRVKKEFFSTFAVADKVKLLNNASEIKKVILTPVGSKSWQEYQDIDSDGRKKLKELLKKLNITILSFDSIGL